jgi:serine/threonine protein kinase
MGLKEGTLESLVESGADTSTVANAVFPQMLQALDCIAWKVIIHRDVKPENILYISHPHGLYQFQLGDFGLCNRAVNATTFAGSELYMAPEMLEKGSQTSKLDIWSLFVTMLWTMDVGGFRRQRCHQFKTIKEAQETVIQLAASESDISKIQDMAVINPEERASAAQMLVKCFNGVGLSTPRDRVPALLNSPSPAIAIRAPAAARRTLKTRTAQTKSRCLPKNADIFAAATAAKYRVEKSRDPLQPPPFRRFQELRPKPPKD